MYYWLEKMFIIIFIGRNWAVTKSAFVRRTSYPEISYGSRYVVDSNGPDFLTLEVDKWTREERAYIYSEYRLQGVHFSSIDPSYAKEVMKSL